jgi:hypothetical protein
MKIYMFCLLFALTSCTGASPTPTITPLVEQDPIAYYTFVQSPDPALAGSVVIIPGELALVPITVPVARGDDVAGNIETALTAMLNDTANLWSSTDLIINGVTFNEGLATVRMTGDITAVGGAILSATGTQFILTVFLEPGVESAIITLNDETIGNLGISHSSQARPADTVYTRADVGRLTEGG